MSAGGFESVAGFVLLAVVAMVFCYLLPTMIRSRQMAADARMDDRFSHELRVLTRNTPKKGETLNTPRGYLHPPRPDRPEAPMEGHAEHPAREPRSAAEVRRTASGRAARAAAASRRAAAARRRLALTLALLAGAIVLWTLFVTIALPIAAPISVSVVLAAVVVLGRRAAARGARADRPMVAAQPRQAGGGRGDQVARERRGTAERGEHQRGRESADAHRRQARADREQVATARHARGEAPVLSVDAQRGATPPVRTSVQDTAASLRISVDPANLGEAAPAQRADIPAGEGWTPIPVPVPTYTLKAEAPRRQVPPYQAPAEPAVQAEEHSAFGEVAPNAPADTAEAERQEVLAEVDALSQQGAMAPASQAGAPAPQSSPPAATAPTASAPTATAAPTAPTAPATAAPTTSEPERRQEPAMNLQEVLERRRAAGQ